jgi:predicted phosphoadenosine phosphosulfate sulfurtransferase
MHKRMLDMNVLDAAKSRIAWSFDRFEKLYISFSGGKDSTVMMHLVMEEAVKRKRKIGCLFIDWECQFTMTIDHISQMYEEYAEWIEPYWVSLPIKTWNGCSMHEPEWTCWEDGKEDLWVRDRHPMSIKDKSFFPFYWDGMMFEEFTPLFAKWYSGGKDCGCLVGIRTAESLNRFRSLARDDKIGLDGRQYTTSVVDNCWNVYPIYDWTVEDDWTYIAKSGKTYNKLYDMMHKAGLTLHQMRIDEPFGDTQRRGLWMYQIIEPKLWAKMSCRVSGANTGRMYGNESGNILGNRSVSLPDGHTWESFAMFLLDSMPPKTSEHYKSKLAKYINWYRTRGYENGIPDYADTDMESRDLVGSWRRIVKALLKNDYWLKTLGFSPTKSSAYDKYLQLMRKKRAEWKLFDGVAKNEPA